MMDLVWFLVIGVVAGWLAGQIMKGSGFGLVGDLVVGVVGAVLGGFLFNALGLPATKTIGQLITATVGAIVLIMALRVLKRSGV
ncbi:MAG: GlsB/YeaQ/YmgE family stress response membrane protein [Isosphaeraceae bacterium]